MVKEFYVETLIHVKGYYLGKNIKFIIKTRLKASQRLTTLIGRIGVKSVGILTVTLQPLQQ